MNKKNSRSKYLVVKCDCGNEQNVFGNVKSEVKCLMCKKILAKPRGGKSVIFGKVLKTIGR